jgi:hypothetical protein
VGEWEGEVGADFTSFHNSRQEVEGGELRLKNPPKLEVPSSGHMDHIEEYPGNWERMNLKKYE